MEVMKIWQNIRILLRVQVMEREKGFVDGTAIIYDFSPFIPGISVRTYTDDWLNEQNARENTPKYYNGKGYTTYEALQAQRRMETTMRKYRQDIKLLQEGGGTEESIILKKARYQGTMQTYKDFSAQMGLPEQMERVYQDGLSGRFVLTKKEQAGLAEKQRYDIIKAELKSVGIKGVPIFNPTIPDLSTYTFDDKHINLERGHNVTRSDAERFIKEADIALSRWNGRFVNYYSADGAAFVDEWSKNIRTAFRKEQFDINALKIREVLEKNGGGKA